MDRREFLRLGGFGGITLLAPSMVLWGPRSAHAEDTGFEPPAGTADRVLVLVELNGGNDGLNTIVPYRDDAYYRLRPRLAWSKEDVTPLGNDLALAPPLTPLLESWEARDLAIVHGVGYDQPNRSHFRSIEIWETASDADEYRDEGWIAQLQGQHEPPADLAADGVILRGGAGPLHGSSMRNVSMQDPQRLARRAGRLGEAKGRGVNPALDHLLDVRAHVRHAAEVIEELHGEAPSQAEHFPRTRLGQQLRIAAELILGRVPLSVIKTSIGSFDTHSGQRGQHQRLLGELAGAVSAFRRVLRQHDRWDDVLGMTYSEFGRRPAENGSAGTDHGTAAPHFVWGGRVAGGSYGTQPSLTDLRNEDLRHHVDYRRLYATVARDWWQLPAATVTALGHDPLPLVSRGSKTEEKSGADSSRRERARL